MYIFQSVSVNLDVFSKNTHLFTWHLSISHITCLTEVGETLSLPFSTRLIWEVLFPGEIQLSNPNNSKALSRQSWFDVATCLGVLPISASLGRGQDIPSNFSEESDIFIIVRNMLTYITLSCETCQDFYIKPENRNFVLSYPSNVHTLLPVPPPALTLLIYWLVSGGHEHEGVAGSWQTEEHWTKPDLSQTHDTGPWEDQRRKCRTFPFWSVHPLHKPVGWCASSLHKETTVCFLLSSGALANCPSCAPFHLVFSPGIKLLP